MKTFKRPYIFRHEFDVKDQRQNIQIIYNNNFIKSLLKKLTQKNPQILSHEN